MQQTQSTAVLKAIKQTRDATLPRNYVRWYRKGDTDTLGLQHEQPELD
jgi:hypothetical protein